MSEQEKTETIVEKAERLDEILHKYYQANSAEKAKMIKGMVTEMPNLVTTETLDILIKKNDPSRNFQRKLETAAQKAIQTPLHTRREGDVKDWALSYAVVANDAEGNILGGAVTLGAEKSLPNIIIKNMLVALIDDPEEFENPGDLTDENNIDYVEVATGLKLQKDFFQGGAKPTKFEGKTLYIAAGHCEPNLEYTATIDRYGVPGAETAAGAVEYAIAEATKMHLLEPNRGVNLAFPEPEFVGEFRKA